MKGEEDDLKNSSQRPKDEKKEMFQQDRSRGGEGNAVAGSIGIPSPTGTVAGVRQSSDVAG